MTQFIDRRLNGKNKSAVNRQRFIQRFKNQIKKAVSNAIAGRSITNIEGGEKITIPAKDISEPHFQHGPGGRREMIHPGNLDFIKGDKVKRPTSGGGTGQSGGSQASNTGEGQDDFGFDISREEFLELFFEDLALPNLVKTQLSQVEAFKWVRAGFSQTGVPTNINIVRSLKTALGRRTALTGNAKQELLELETQLAEQEKTPGLENEQVITSLKDRIKELRRKIESVPFVDTFDLRYNNRVRQPHPTTNAVMFCLMDVSGSMDEAKKDVAKRFFYSIIFIFNPKL